MSGKSTKSALKLLGKVTLTQVQEQNRTSGPQWLGAINAASSAVKVDFPNIDGIHISGAKAHRSHEVPSHSNVISAKFFAGKTRVVSGHIHLDGTVDYGRPRGNTGSDREEGPSTRNSGNRPESGESSAWKPAREYVDTGNWTIYDSDKRKTREVREENGWWYIETRKGKVYF